MRKSPGIIQRPMASGHLGEWVASRIFDIELAAVAVEPGFDGRFRSLPLQCKTERSNNTLRHRRLPARVLYLRNFRASQIPERHLLLFEIVVNVGDLGRRLDASDDDFRLSLITRRHP
jgi:hypothetical protein